MSKGKAFVMCYCAVIFIFLAMIAISFIAKDYGLIPVAACLTAIVTVTGGYIGMQVANNGVKGKCWNNDMYEHENKETGGKQ